MNGLVARLRMNRVSMCGEAGDPHFHGEANDGTIFGRRKSGKKQPLNGKHDKEDL